MEDAEKVDENISLDSKIRDHQQRIIALLAPYESYILLLERILVWELPYVSAALIVSVHILFWLATTVRIYYLCGVTCMILVLLDVCFMYFTLPEREWGSSTSIGWTELHPGLLGVPELSHAIAEYWDSGLRLLDTVIVIRTNNRPKFFVLSVIYLAAGAVLGTYVPGFWLAYITVMGLLICPCLSYHKFHPNIDSVVSRFEEKFYIKRKRQPHKGGKGKKDKKLAMVEDDSDSDDAIIDEFLPSLNRTKVVTELTSAPSDDDFEPSYPSLGQLASALSKSRNHNDNGDEVSVLTHGLGTEMPSIDDVDDSKDHTDDGSLRYINNGSELDLVDAGNSDSEADEENFTAGLSFDDDTANRANSVAVGGSALLGGILSEGQSTMLAALSSPAVSSLMTSAATGLTTIRDAVSRAHRSVSAHGTDDAACDTDILDAEFEFLNDEEFNRIDNYMK